jgi:uncharacterized protein (DUF1330 family)
LQITVNLWITDGQRDLFNEYENIAVKVMSKYGGKLISASAIETSSVPNPPDEIHLLEFPTRQSFEKFREDEELAKFSSMRSKCINRTEIYIGRSNHILL